MSRVLGSLRTVATLIAALAFVHHAQAAGEKLWDQCANYKQLSGRAVEACTKILSGRETRKKQAEALVNRAYAYMYRYQYELAVADFAHAIKLNPKNAEAFAGRAALFSRRDEALDHKRAVDDAVSAIKLDPTYISRFVDRPGEDAYTKLIAQDPTNPELYAARAEAYFLMKSFDLARADAEKSLQLAPNNIDAKATLRAIEQFQPLAGEKVRPPLQDNSDNDVNPSDFEGLGDLGDLDELD
jgi:tetratricopeptide (TPR) repeat protein